ECIRIDFVMDDIFFFFQAEDGIRDRNVTGVQTCALSDLDHSGHCHATHEWLGSGIAIERIDALGKTYLLDNEIVFLFGRTCGSHPRTSTMISDSPRHRLTHGQSDRMSPSRVLCYGIDLLSSARG